MPIQYPSQRPSPAPIDIMQRQTLNQQGITSNAMIQERQQREYDDDMQADIARTFVGIGQQGEEWITQDPTSWPKFRNDVVKHFERFGLPTENISAPDADPREVAEAMRELQKRGQMMGQGLLAAQESTEPKNALPAKIQQAEWWMSADPEQRAGYMSANYAGKVQDIGGVPHWVMPGGDSVPLSTVEDETSGQSQIAAGVAGAQTQAKGEETRVQGLINQGQEVADSLPVLKRSMALLETVNTGGKLVEAQLEFAKALGIETADQGELSANLGKAVLSQLRETFGAQFTEAEGQRLVAIEAGFGKNNATNMRLLGQAIAIVEAKANRAIKLARDNGDEVTAQIIEDMLQMSLNPTDDSNSVATIKYDAQGNRIE